MEFVFCRHFHYQFYLSSLPIVVLTSLNYLIIWLGLSHKLIRLYLNFAIFLATLYFYYFFVNLTKPTIFFTVNDLIVLVSLMFSVVSLLEILLVNIIYTNSESLFYLKNVARLEQCCSKIYWIEFAIKLCYPISYILFFLLYSLVYLY